MPFSDPVIGHLGWVALALGSAILGGGRRRRLGAAGLVFVGLGLAAWRVSRVGTGGSLPALDDSGAGFLVVNGGLVLLGLGLLLWGAVADGDSPSRPAAGAAIVTGALLVAWGHLPAAGLVGAAALAAGLGLAGAGLIVLGRAVASTGAARGMGRLFGPPLPPATLSRDNARFVALIVVGATAAAAGPSVAVVFLGVVVAAWGGYLAFHSRAARPAPVSPALALVLAPAYWLLATIAGPVGLRTDALPLVPISPAAESLVAAALLLAGWSAAGLWPLHRQLPGAIVGPVGALLLVRIAIPLAPGGLEQWRPLVVPVLVVGMWHAAAHGRWPLLAVGGALLGIVSPAEVGMVGAGWLLCSALVLEVGGVIRLPPRVSRIVQAAAWISGAWGGVLVLDGALRGEVVYTALGAVGVALLVLAPERHRSLS